MNRSEEILAALKKGEKSAFQAFFSEYYEVLVLFATGILKDVDAAEDVVQDCFVRLWDDYAELEEDEAPMLLFTMMRHRCLNFLKHKRIVREYADRQISRIRPDRRGGGKNVSIISVFPITRPNTLIFIRSWSARSSVSRIRFLSAAARFSSSAVFRG